MGGYQNSMEILQHPKREKEMGKRDRIGRRRLERYIGRGLGVVTLNVFLVIDRVTERDQIRKKPNTKPFKRLTPQRRTLRAPW